MLSSGREMNAVVERNGRHFHLNAVIYVSLRDPFSSHSPKSEARSTAAFLNSLIEPMKTLRIVFTVTKNESFTYSNNVLRSV